VLLIQLPYVAIYILILFTPYYFLSSLIIFKSTLAETWRVILVSVSWQLPLKITAHPRGALLHLSDYHSPNKCFHASM